MRPTTVTVVALLCVTALSGTAAAGADRALQRAAAAPGPQAAQTAARQPKPPPLARCWAEWGNIKRTVLFVADPGTFSGTPEAAHYLANIQRNKTVPDSQAACPQVVVGIIMGLPVAVITTGIGTDAASTCSFEVLMRCGDKIKDATFAGTSGWSPQLGGVLNNGTCEAGDANDNGRITRLGDVCVSPFSVNWACRKASWRMTAKGNPNECTFPEQQFSAMNTPLFGQCYFASGVESASLPLANEIIAAGRAYMAASGSTRPPLLQAEEVAYWGNISEGTGLSYNVPFNAKPTIWDYTQCMPISAQYFWSGAPWDMVSRKYVADTINTAAIPGVNVTQSDVIAVTEMESIGVAMSFERYSTFGRVTPIPYTVVRAMSNWAMQPVIKNGTVPDSSDTLWVEGVEQPEDFVNGYAYAIRSASATVLATLQSRCQSAGGRDVAARCQFVL